jgi:uncharacterized protein (TIGR00661 family)
MPQPKRILVCPLDWGLGHATRCIPIIKKLLEKNAEVLVAADGRPLELLKQEFPKLQFTTLKGYGIKYPSSGSMALSMFLSIPKILNGIRKENREIERIIREHKIDVVISDNRYGCYNRNIKSIFITHQLMVKSPFAEKLIHNIISSYIRKYDECWIPDVRGNENLSADLSHKYPLLPNTFFIGPLSRFSGKTISSPEYDLMAIVSGPEPQRSIFERLVSEQIYRNNLRALIVFGIPEGNKKTEKKGNVTMINHLNTDEMEKAIRSSGIIISRSGYSTVMDLCLLEKKAIFIPTPGQTEQEYLADHFMKKRIAYSQKQMHFDLKTALKESESYPGFKKISEGSHLEERINTILS